MSLWGLSPLKGRSSIHLMHNTSPTGPFTSPMSFFSDGSSHHCAVGAEVSGHLGPFSGHCQATVQAFPLLSVFFFFAVIEIEPIALYMADISH